MGFTQDLHSLKWQCFGVWHIFVSAFGKYRSKSMYLSSLVDTNNVFCDIRFLIVGDGGIDAPLIGVKNRMVTLF